MLPRHRLAAVCLCLLAGCGRSSPAPPSPSPPTGGGETITGRERIGWDQPAVSTADLSGFRYAIYVDGNRFDLTEVSCGDSPTSAGYPCSGRLPAMSNGAHVLELASYVEDGGTLVESAKSAQLRVTVTAVISGVEPSPLVNGDQLSTLDGARLTADVLLEGLDEPTALVIAPDGRGYLATSAGVLALKDGVPIGSPYSLDGLVVALALSPAFAADRHVFTIQAVRTDTGATLFRTSRYRDIGGRLAERMVLLEHGPASVPPAAALRFGVDGKLYAAFDDGGSPAAAERMSEWSGKVLRMEPDGRTPADQAAASPVLFQGLTSPRGIDFTTDGSALWIADASANGVERLRVVASTSERPRRAGQRATFVMPRGIGAAAAVFYHDVIKEFAGDLMIAGRDGGYILRVHFDAADRTKPAWTERLLAGRVNTVRTLAIGPDGAIYFCTDRQLVRLRGMVNGEW